MIVVADASPLIAFAQIKELPLLPAIFGEITIPDAVRREIVRSVPRQTWISPRSLRQPLPHRIAHSSVDLGEKEALALALELHAEWVVLDDLQARRLAGSLGLTVIGTVGVLIRARERGLITEVRPRLDALLAVRFYLSPATYQRALALAGEI